MMNFLILIIVAPVLYILLGTGFGILLTLLRTDNLKLKIVLLTFLRPITYAFLLSLLLPTLFDDTWIWLSGFTLAVVFRAIVFSNQKFLSSVTNHNVYISIQYINTFLQTKRLDLMLDNKTKLRLLDMNSIVDYPASFNIGGEDDTQKFIILTKKIWDIMDANLNSHNIRFASMLKDETQHQQ